MCVAGVSGEANIQCTCDQTRTGALRVLSEKRLLLLLYLQVYKTTIQYVHREGEGVKGGMNEA